MTVRAACRPPRCGQRGREQRRGMGQTMECRSCARGLDHSADVRYKGASERLHGFTVVAPCAPGSGRADGCRPPVSQQFDGLQAVPDTQAYVQRHVRFHVGADLSQRVLRTGDDMHAQGTPQRGDAHQPVHIVGQLVVQRMELVDDDDQRGRRGLQLPDRADTLRGDQMLPASQLQLQRPPTRERRDSDRGRTRCPRYAAAAR